MNADKSILLYYLNLFFTTFGINIVDTILHWYKIRTCIISLNSYNSRLQNRKYFYIKQDETRLTMDIVR